MFLAGNWLRDGHVIHLGSMRKAESSESFLVP